jgi:hypothetical protein
MLEANMLRYSALTWNNALSSTLTALGSHDLDIVFICRLRALESNP